MTTFKEYTWIFITIFIIAVVFVLAINIATAIALAMFPHLKCSDGSPEIQKTVRSSRGGYYTDWFCPYENVHFSNPAWTGEIELRHIYKP